MASNGTIPKEAAKIWELGKFEIDRINEIENKARRHCVFNKFGENIGPEARFHQGMTSSDVLIQLFQFKWCKLQIYY